MDTLFVARVERWGYFDPRTARAYVHDEHARGDGDLLDYAAVQTFLTGRTVYVTDPHQLPIYGPLASVLRYFAAGDVARRLAGARGFSQRLPGAGAP